jgi:clusterin-associated protein 1
VRPEHMDEYEKLEQELEKFYQVYIDKFRNLDYLENQLDVYNTKEQEKRDEIENKLAKI